MSNSLSLLFTLSNKEIKKKLDEFPLLNSQTHGSNRLNGLFKIKEEKTNRQQFVALQLIFVVVFVFGSILSILIFIFEPIELLLLAFFKNQSCGMKYATRMSVTEQQEEEEKKNTPNSKWNMIKRKRKNRIDHVRNHRTKALAVFFFCAVAVHFRKFMCIQNP